MAGTIDTGTTGGPGWWLDRLSRRLTDRVRAQQVYEDYYHGDHRLSYATRKLLEAFGETFRYLRVNYCGVVVDALAERLEVQGFRFGDDQGAADAAWAIWQRNGMDARFAHGLREGLIKGESSLAVWVDDLGEPTLSVEDPFEVIVATDPASRVRRAALKRWQDADTHRTFATVCLPDATYKYQSQATRLVTAGRWERRFAADEPWPLPNPLDVDSSCGWLQRLQTLDEPRRSDAGHRFCHRLHPGPEERPRRARGGRRQGASRSRPALA